MKITIFPIFLQSFFTNSVLCLNDFRIYCYFCFLIQFMLKKLFIFIVIVAGIFASCERDAFITDPDAKIRFSMDTLYFDTVFTELSTVTKSFTIHNPNKEYVKISRIQLAKGENSVFRINMDGLPGTDFRNIEIPPKDSIYIFVEATLDPNNNDEILLQQDSIITETNGNMQDIDLVAWGQDVHMIREGLLKTQTWINDKPYLIIDYAIVDSLETLTLDPGVRVYLHRDAIFAVGGTLITNGEKDKQVSFAGDRLEKLYEDIPGQWGGIYFFAGTRDNKINYTEIKCANFGIIVDTFMNENPTIELTNSTISHMSSVGILARGAKVKGVNNQIYNCGSTALALTIGGSYEFYHCTIANRWAFSPVRSDPSVYLSNYYFYNDTLPSGVVVQRAEVRDIEKAYFGNCIIWGSRDNELIIDKFPDEGILEYSFENCLGKFNPEKVQITEEHFINLINYEDPKFISWDEYDFQLDTLSPAKDVGKLSIGNLYPIDLNGESRITDGMPDIGAFERIEGGGE